MIHSQEISIFLKKNSRIVLLFICLFYLFNGISYLRSQSITTDESGFYNYAKRLVQGNPARTDPVIDNSKTPVIVLNLIPRIAEQLIHPHRHKSDWGTEDIIRGRYITLVVSALVILLVYLWAGELYGVSAGLFAAFLISLNPNMLALAGLVTTDAYSVLFLLFPFYCLWKMETGGSFKYFLLFSLGVALAQLTKPSLFHLYLLIPLTLVVYYIIYRPAVTISRLIKGLVVFILIQWLVINLGYYFSGTNSSLGSYHFSSRLFQFAQQALPYRLPVPLPKPFVEELDLSKYYDQLGGGYPWSSYGKITILGKSSVGGSFWYYYIISFLFKTPVTYFILLIWAILAWYFKSGSGKPGKHVLFLMMPVLYFFFVLSFFYKTQLGIRHIIFLYPFLCILSASLIPRADSGFKKNTLAILSAYLMISVFYYWGNYYPYTNELIIRKSMAYKIVGSTNLEFHQGVLFADDFLKKHPHVKWAESRPDTGNFIIRVDDYLDVWGLHKYDWISSIKPYGHVAFNYLLIRVDAPGLKK